MGSWLALEDPACWFDGVSNHPKTILRDAIQPINHNSKSLDTNDEWNAWGWDMPTKGWDTDFFHVYTSAGVCFVTPRAPTRKEFGVHLPWTATYVSSFSSSFYGKVPPPGCNKTNPGRGVLGCPVVSQHEGPLLLSDNS